MLCSAFLPPTRLPAYRACVRVYLRVGGRSIHLRSTELLTTDFKKINHSQVRGEGMRKQRRIKGLIFFSPTRLSLSARIKFSQLPPVAFMDTICLLRDHCRRACDGCMDTQAVEEPYLHNHSSVNCSFDQATVPIECPQTSGIYHISHLVYQLFITSCIDVFLLGFYCNVVSCS